jgi:tRNA(Arg) A34 adenosine deaminase TadA
MAQHEQFIRQCHSLAISAGKKGNHTFGAALVHDGRIIMTAENTVNSDDDSTRHAELNLVVKSQRAFEPEVLAESTLYTSTAPCLMCTATIWSAGISRIVYSVSYEAFARLVAPTYRYIPCGEVFERLGTAADIIGPVLEKEGLEVFKFWPQG